ncbi:hypothetical protein [Amaricoccus solimangrovi]|uniref:Uncharacterized protein n=1 Tax=Amaricoccus solimangrovi TaxID=2589815 RepID=A0A501WJ04_9RHOB|nr:hypothetical protein [Amaricoccus solimangrovi]TPE49873.1 hypothetical protein FJM51_12975 [Amaricoccus solimangrovi]
MFENAGRVIFTTLHEVALAKLGAGHACVSALARAAAEPEAAAVAEAETALRALPEAERTAIMGAAHARLRSDPAAWLALWPAP